MIGYDPGEAYWTNNASAVVVDPSVAFYARRRRLVWGVITFLSTLAVPRGYVG